MPEIGSLGSKQFCRGHNVAGRMVEQLFTDAEKAGITGAYSISVGFHPSSQKIFNRQGFVPVGMILHYLPAKNAWDYAEGNRRMGIFVCAKMFRDPGRKTIYIPENHRDFICGIYSRLNIVCDCRTSVSGRQSLPQSQYIINQDRNLLMAEFLIQHIEDDFEEDPAHIMQDFKDSDMELVKVYLSISHLSAFRAYDILENNGYYFSGILPGCENCAYLMMGHLIGLPMKWDHITPDGENQMALDYI